MTEANPGETQPLTLEARYVFPVTGDPIPDGMVTFRDWMIHAVGTKPGKGEVRDLGNVAILPGFVNAHTHLEFSDLAQPLGRPGMGFVDWIEEVIAYRRQCTEPAWRAVAKGLAECVRLGTTAVGEIAQPGWSAQPFREAGLDATVFLELIALGVDRLEEVLALAEEHVEAGDETVVWHAGISPHSPYTTDITFAGCAALLSSRRRVPLAFHLAESREEMQRAASQSGPLWEFLVKIVGPERAKFLGGGNPEDWVGGLSPSHRALVIHGNYLSDRAIAQLADHADHMTVVHCPRTHAYFGHDPYPLERMLRAGVAVTLGTDSRASSPDLNMLAEMRFAASRHPSVPRSTILRMGTHLGAVALGRAERIGSLSPAKKADLAIVRLPDRDAADPHDLLFDSEEPVVATWISGVERELNS
jgi:cytosine/adenosine deaminase-related metal-dependent hydrolase